MFQKKFRTSNQSINIDKQISNKHYTIENDKVGKPKNGFDFSISFWIYINDHDYNFGNWKHLIHKGTHPDTQLLSYNDFNIFNNILPEQNPGIWLDPYKNDMIIAFSTRDKNTLHSNEDAYINGKETITCKNDDEGKLETITIPNIPIKIMTHIGLILDNKILYIYLNGKLLKTKKFKGTPFTNSGDYYFNFPKTFDGELYNFKYVPYTIKPDQIYLLSKDIPNTNRFTKKKRIKNYLSRLKFKKAVSVFF